MSFLTNARSELNRRVSQYQQGQDDERLLMEQYERINAPGYNVGLGRRAVAQAAPGFQQYARATAAAGGSGAAGRERMQGAQRSAQDSAYGAAIGSRLQTQGVAAGLLGQHFQNRQFQMQLAEQRRQFDRQNAGGLGGILGAVGGTILGGPAGAAIGSSIAGAVTGGGGNRSYGMQSMPEPNYGMNQDWTLSGNTGGLYDSPNPFRG